MTTLTHRGLHVFGVQQATELHFVARLAVSVRGFHGYGCNADEVMNLCGMHCNQIPLDHECGVTPNDNPIRQALP